MEDKNRNFPFALQNFRSVGSQALLPAQGAEDGPELHRFFDTEKPEEDVGFLPCQLFCQPAERSVKHHSPSPPSRFERLNSRFTWENTPLQNAPSSGLGCAFLLGATSL